MLSVQGAELFAMLDVNGDDEIDYLEFQRWVRGHAGSLSVKAEFEFETEKEFANLWQDYRYTIVYICLHTRAYMNETKKQSHTASMTKRNSGV